MNEGADVDGGFEWHDDVAVALNFEEMKDTSEGVCVYLGTRRIVHGAKIVFREMSTGNFGHVMWSCNGWHEQGDKKRRGAGGGELRTCIYDDTFELWIGGLRRDQCVASALLSLSTDLTVLVFR